jgi:hypothetical protein
VKVYVKNTICSKEKNLQRKWSGSLKSSVHGGKKDFFLTPWNRALPEKLIDIQLVKKVTAFYGT